MDGKTMTTPLVHRLTEADFKPGLRDFLGYRKFGVEQLTHGMLGIQQIKAVKSTDGFTGTGAHRHHLAFQMVYVLAGWVVFEIDGEKVRLEAGDSLVLPPSIAHSQVGYSNDVSMLEITAPADFRTEDIHSH